MDEDAVDVFFVGDIRQGKGIVYVRCSFFFGCIVDLIKKEYDENNVGETRQKETMRSEKCSLGKGVNRFFGENFIVILRIDDVR